MAKNSFVEEVTFKYFVLSGYCSNVQLTLSCVIQFKQNTQKCDSDKTLEHSIQPNFSNIRTLEAHLKKLNR